MDWGQFAGLAGLMLVLFGWLKLDIRDLRVAVDRLVERVSGQGERLARIEGQLGISEPTA
ncbi:MAG: hypothetical protein OXI26_00645 [bacterium]|nr:hypothetical protein [bacterium]